MKVTVEISLYSLQDNYEQVVLDFIAQLNANPNITVETNGLSTQIFGDYDEVMKEFLPARIKEVFEKGKAVVLMKVAQGHLHYDKNSASR